MAVFRDSGQARMTILCNETGMSTLLQLRAEVKNAFNAHKAKFLSGFFKTGKGEYAEGDIFYGLTVPESRKIALKYKELSFEDITSLLQSKIHEERLIALLILVDRFKSAICNNYMYLIEYFCSSEEVGILELQLKRSK